MTRSSLKQQREQKGNEKPQQQKKRKNNNPFVFPEKKIPAVDKTPYIFRTPIDLTGSRTVRCFTPEEREAYLKKLKETELTTYPLSSSSGRVRVLAVAGMLCIILPCRPRRMGRPILPATSKLWFVILGGCISSVVGRRKNPN